MLRIKSQAYSGVSVGEAGLFWGGFWRQMLAALPLDYCVNFLSHSVSLKQLLIAGVESLHGLLILFLGVGFAWWLLRASIKQQVVGSKYIVLLLVACPLIFFPPILIGLSERYQREVHQLGAHITVYFSYFGMSLVFAAFAHYVLFKLKERHATWIVETLICVLSILVGGVLMVTYEGNKVAVSNIISHFRDPTSFMENSLRAGLLREATDGDVLYVIKYPGTMLNQGFVKQYSGKTMHIITSDGPLPLPFTPFSPRKGARVWVWSGSVDSSPRWLSVALLADDFTTFSDAKQNVCQFKSLFFCICTEGKKSLTNVRVNRNGIIHNISSLELRHVQLGVNLLGRAYGKRSEVKISDGTKIDFDVCSLDPQFN